eukprot:7381713-Prymnesium_polylepis.1
MRLAASAGSLAYTTPGVPLVLSLVVDTSRWTQKERRSKMAFDGNVRMHREFGPAVTDPFGCNLNRLRLNDSSLPTANLMSFGTTSILCNESQKKNQTVGG